jgi:hypothetical protein
MSAHSVRQTTDVYIEALLARRDYSRFSAACDGGSLDGGEENNSSAGFGMSDRS